MRKLVGLVLSLFALVAFSFTSFGQMIPPAKMSYTLDKTSVKVGDVIEVTFIGKIPESYHMYSTEMGCRDMGPVPTTFEYNTNATFELVGKVFPVNPHKYTDDIFNCEVAEFEGTSQFKQKIRILSASPKISGLMEYQMCSNESGVCVLHEYEYNITGFSVTGGSTTDQVAPTQEVEPTTDKTEEPEKPTVSAGIDSATLARFMKCLDCGDDESQAHGAFVSADEVNYSSYQRSGETDTSSCELKTYDGETSEEHQSYWGFFLIAFLSGLIALLTPCVFPMIPMTVSFFMKDGSRSKAIRNGLIYALSIVGIYVVIGTIVAATAGEDAAHFLSTHWLPNVFFFLVFVIFAASFFGAFEITLPSKFVNKVDKQADKGGLAGIFFMAFTIVLVSFSCTGPIVGSILVEAAGGQFLKPLIGMFGFSLAFAIPFGLFAIFPGWLNNLPQSGGWLNSVKVVLGFLELALGLKFLSVADQTYHWGILDREVYIALWIVIFLLLGLYLLGKLRFSHDSEPGPISVPRLLLAISTFAFVGYLIPGMVGAPLKQLAGYLPPMSTHDYNIVEAITNPDGRNKGHDGFEPKYNDKLHIAHGIHGYFDYEQGMEVARILGKPAFIDFTGHGCVNCREMEARVWSDNRVRQMLDEDYVTISLYTDDKEIMLPEEEYYYSKYSGRLIKSLAKKNADIEACYFGANVQPLYALLDNHGNLLQPTKGYDLDVEAYVNFLKDGLKEYKKRTTGEEDSK